MNNKSRSIPKELVRLKANEIWKNRLREGRDGTAESDWIEAKEYLEKHWWKVFLWRLEKIINRLGKSITRRLTTLGNRTWLPDWTWLMNFLVAQLKERYTINIQWEIHNKHSIAVTHFLHRTRWLQPARGVSQTFWHWVLLLVLLFTILLEKDHLHIILQYTPQIQLSKLVNNLKTVSSRYLKQEFPDRFSQFYWKDALWSDSYFISSCGGVTVDVLKKYT